MTNRQVFFSTAISPSHDIDLLRNEAIKNEFKLQYLNTIINKNKEDEITREKNWQLFFKKMTYLLFLFPIKRIAAKRRRRAKSLSYNTTQELSHLSFFKKITIKKTEKIHVEPLIQQFSSNEFSNEMPILAH